MRILVTGSSGQIGTNLALALLARGDEVLGVDKTPNRWTDEIPAEMIDLTVPGALTAASTVASARFRLSVGDHVPLVARPTWRPS